MKHIKMPKAIAEAWLKDLRANPKQGVDRLQDENGGYCCLGRLQVVVSGDVERYGDSKSYRIPSLEWLEENNIKFIYSSGFKGRSPHCAEKNCSFDSINDMGTPFSAIADLLEDEIEYND